MHAIVFLFALRGRERCVWNHLRSIATANLENIPLSSPGVKGPKGKRPRVTPKSKPTIPSPCTNSTAHLQPNQIQPNQPIKTPVYTCLDVATTQTITFVHWTAHASDRYHLCKRLHLHAKPYWLLLVKTWEHWSASTPALLTTLSTRVSARAS